MPNFCHTTLALYAFKCLLLCPSIHSLIRDCDCTLVAPKPSLAEVLPTNRSFDVVVCFGGMQNSFASQKAAETFLANVTCRLREGGYFFGFLPDSSAIWHAL